MYTIYWLKSIDGIKLRLKHSVRTAGSVKLEGFRRGCAEIVASNFFGLSYLRTRVNTNEYKWYVSSTLTNSTGLS